jgi:hypothetical protein
MPVYLTESTLFLSVNAVAHLELILSFLVSKERCEDL